MKKSIITLALFAAIATGATAQVNGSIQATAVQTTEGVLKIDKVERPAFLTEYNISTTVMEDALKNVFKSKGIKLEKSKGLWVAKAVAIPEMANGVYDLYFDISKASKDKEKSLVKMAMSSGYDNFINATMPEQQSSAKRYVSSSLSPLLHTQKLQADITSQTEAYSKAQKKYNDLLKEAEKLEKQKKSLEDDIVKNKRDQEMQLKEIERQKILVEQLKSTEIK